MASHSWGGASGVVRVHPEAVVPLELWDLLIGDRIISECMDAPDFPALLLRAIGDLLEGRAVTRWSPSDPLKICCGADFVFVGGGGALREGLTRVLKAAPVPTLVSDEGPFTAEAGGWEVLGELRAQGMVVDVGQTAIKVSVAGRRFIRARDQSALPFSGGIRSKLRPGQRHEMVGFIGKAIGNALATVGEDAFPRAAAIALPCQIDDGGVPGPSSYKPLFGDRRIIPEACAQAGLAGAQIFVLNDAEMAAVAARQDPRVPRWGKGLVLTLGSGLGGAVLLERRAQPRPPRITGRPDEAFFTVRN